MLREKVSSMAMSAGMILWIKAFEIKSKGDHCKCLWQKNVAPHVELQVVRWQSTTNRFISFDLVQGIGSQSGNIIGWRKINLIKLFILTQLPCIILTDNYYCSNGTGIFQRGSGSLECKKMSNAHERLKAISIISVRNNMSSHHSNFQHDSRKKSHCIQLVCSQRHWLIRHTDEPWLDSTSPSTAA